MATYNFSALADGQSISFNPNADVLNFDQAFISAADIRAATEGTATRIALLTPDGAVTKSIVLLNTAPPQLATSNTTFVNGSQLLFGDNSAATAGDNLANTLTGTGGNDLLQGFGGADTMSGGLGNDTYIVSTGDVLSDTGGVDTVISDVSWTLATGFENLTLTGTTRTDATGNNASNVIIGSDAANFINGRAGDDTIRGMGGNDSIDMSTGGTGNIGNRSIDGGAGIDTVDYDGYAQSAVSVNLATGKATGGGTNGTGSASIFNVERLITGAFNDNVIGSLGDDYLDGRGGNDTVNGNNGNDSVMGGAGDDVLRGEQGNDTLVGGIGADSFFFAVAPGSANADVVSDFAPASDKLWLDGNVYSAIGAPGNFAAGDARFFSAPGAASGHDADDRIVYNTTTGQLFYDADGSGAGAAQLVATLTGAPAIAATDIAVDNGTGTGAPSSGNDSIIGTPGNDTLDGGAGNDTVDGNGGADLLLGGAGNDSLVGLAFGTPSVDPADRYVGGDGDDTMDGWNIRNPGVVVDTMDGGLGNDLFIVDNAADVLTDAGGIDTVDARDIDWTLAAGFENLNIRNDVSEGHANGFGNELDNRMTISFAGGRLEGRGGNDTLIGSARGEDTLVGGDGNDVLQGGGGPRPEVLDGGAGNDTLTGSSDTSYIFAVAPGAANADVITNFHAATLDRIRLDGGSYTNIGGSGNFVADDARFFAGAGATSGHDADDRVVYNTTTGQLFYDADGSGAGASQLIATLQGAPAITAVAIAVDNGTGGQTITGTAGNDSITGTTGNDTIDGGAGDDTINGGAGNDSLVGGAGNDSIFGAEGVDTMVGGDGNDTLNGDNAPFGANTDADVETYDGGLGNDLFIVDNAADVLADAGGVDTVRAVFVNWTLGAGFENLQMFNAEAETSRSGTGNELANLMDASAGGWGVLMDGRGGNDTLLGSAFGVDTLLGGEGNDSIDGGEHPDSIDGGAGDDTLLGGAGIWQDTLSGGDGNDVISGGEDHDTMTGGLGADAFVFAAAPGAVNADLITDFAATVDRIHLDGTVFTAVGASGNFVAGDERFFAGAFGGTPIAHDATDRVMYDTSNGNLWYDPDGNGAAGPQLFATLQGAPAASATDIVVVNGNGPAQGGSGNDSIIGTGGNDTIDGGPGNDTLDGAAGNDSLIGNAGDDSLIGGIGDDTLVGGDGADTLRGGDGNDVLRDASGSNVLDGGPGDDFYVIGSNPNTLLDSGGIDTIQTFDVQITLAAGFENAEMFTTVAGSASITGNELDNSLRQGGTTDTLIDGLGGNDSLFGGDGVDTLLGGAGNDILFGDFGNDILRGGAGNDTLQGQDGGDSFVFAEAGGADADQINVFTLGADKIRLDGTFFTAIGASGNFAAGDARFFSAAGATSGHDADDRVVYDTTTGQLFYDADGSGAGASQLVATLIEKPALAATDIAVDNGQAGASVQGTAGNDRIDGTAGNDTIDGAAGDDTIAGQAGDDSLLGGAGNDSLMGMAGSDVLRGGDGDDTLDGIFGGTGADIDTLDGGLGNDVFQVTSQDVISDAGGVDTVVAHSWTLGAGFENLSLFDDASGTTSVGTGNALGNRIDASAGANLIDAGDGNDVVVDRGAGIDTIHGGLGNDTIDGGATPGVSQLFGDAGDDQLTANGNAAMSGGAGIDTFTFAKTPGGDPAGTHSSITDFTPGTEKIVLDGSFHADVGASGNFIAGDARFYSAAGATSGHDATDRVVYDTATGNLWYDADGNAAGASQLVATVQGAPALSATDVAVVNGTSTTPPTTDGSGQRITGTAGNDSLTGTDGDDTLDGGAGADTMAGGLGNDTYVVDNSLDVVSDTGGVDTVVSSISWTLGSGFENLTLTNNTTRTDAAGNNLANVIIGSDAANFINGRAGDDTIYGMGGNDSIDMSTGGTGFVGNRVIDGGAGTDTVDYSGYARSAVTANLATGVVTGGGLNGTGSATMTSVERLITDSFDDSLTGGNASEYLDGRGGNDTVNGGLGNDTLIGGLGNDTFVFSTAPSASNVDTVNDFTSGTDRLAFDDSSFTALGATGGFTANDPRFYSGAGVTAAHDADDRVIYDTTSGALYYDSDGNATAAPTQQVATLAGHPALAATDLSVV